VSGYIIAEDKEVADDISKFEVINTEADLGKGAMRGLTRIEDLGKLQQVNTKSGSNTPLLNKTMTNITTVDSDDNSSDDEDESENGTSKNKDSSSNIDKANSTLSIGLSELPEIEKRCHMSPIRVNLADVTFETMYNSELADQHILVCGLVANLFNFVMPLRAKYLEQISTIVILHIEKPSDKQWN
jgi:hypothetical protein